MRKKKVKKAVKTLENPQILATRDIQVRSQKLAPYTKKYGALTTVETEEQYVNVSAALNWARAEYAAAEKERKEIVKPFNDGVKAINARYKKSITGPLKDLIETIEEPMKVYLRAKQEVEKKLAEREAKKAEKKGEMQFAQDLRTEALRISPAPKSEVTTKRVWFAAVVDFKLFLQGILDGVVDPEFIKVDQAKLNAIARAMKKENLGIAGVKGVNDFDFSRKGGF